MLKKASYNYFLTCFPQCNFKFPLFLSLYLLNDITWTQLVVAIECNFFCCCHSITYFGIQKILKISIKDLQFIKFKRKILKKNNQILLKVSNLSLLQSYFIIKKNKKAQKSFNIIKNSSNFFLIPILRILTFTNSNVNTYANANDYI